jgi:hypothetical protein
LNQRDRFLEDVRLILDHLESREQMAAGIAEIEPSFKQGRNPFVGSTLAGTEAFEDLKRLLQWLKVPLPSTPLHRRQMALVLQNATR